jgi:hypothetical protein
VLPKAIKLALETIGINGSCCVRGLTPKNPQTECLMLLLSGALTLKEEKGLITGSDDGRKRE